MRVGVFCKGWCKVGARVRIVGGFHKGSCTGVVASFLFRHWHLGISQC